MKSSAKLKNLLNWSLAVFVSAFILTSLAACGGSGGSGTSTPTTAVAPSTSATTATCTVGQVETATGCTSATTGSGTYIGALDAINSSTFENMLKLMGYCDQYSLVNFGDENCSTYDTSAYLVVQLDGTYAQAVLYAGTSNLGETNGSTIPISVSGTLNPINNSTGYVIQSSTGLQLYIDTGTLSGSTLPAQLTYQGGTLGTVSLQLSQ